ncbi:hypothetical protein [Ensifer canadensis]
MADTANTVYRDFVTDGVPSSGKNNPGKAAIRRLLTGYETIINAFLSNGGVIYSSKAAMDADLAHAANSMAWVMGDPTVANNGIYRKNGASGAGSWTRVADLPISFIIASDGGAGSPNAIQATTSIPVSGSALIWANIFETNTGSPVTISFNGAAPLTVKTNAGNDPSPAGGLQAGMIVLGIVQGSTFRLVSDQTSAALLAQVEAVVDGIDVDAFLKSSEVVPDANLKFRDNIGDSLNPVRSWRGYPELGTLTFAGATASSSGGYLKLTSTSGDPLLRIIGIGIGGFVERYLGLRYRRISGTPGIGSADAVFWGTSGHGSDDGAYRMEFSPAAAGAWQTVILDMWEPTSGGDDWRDSTVNAVRFDLFSGVGAEVEISWISTFGDAPRRGDAQNEAFFVRFWPDTSTSPFATPRVRVGANDGRIESVIPGSENNGWGNFVSPIGRAGSMHGSRSSDNPTVGDSGTYASGHFVLHDSAKEAWGQYTELRVEIGARGGCGHEINPINKKPLIANDPYNIYAPHSVTGQILSSGRPDVPGGTSLSSFMNVQANGADADKGFNFGFDSVTIKDGQADVINFAKFHAIQQWTDTGFRGAGIRFEVVDSTQSLMQIFGDGYVKWRLRDAGLDALLLTTTLLTTYVPVKFPSFTKAAKPSASATGAGATIDISNDTSNRRLATSDGTNWRFQDGTVVPAS